MQLNQPLLEVCQAIKLLQSLAFLPLLKDHLSRRVKHGTKPGTTPYLSQTEEKGLTGHLSLAAQSGYGKTHQDVMCTVEGYVNSQNPSCTVSISNRWWWNFKKKKPFS